MIAAIGRAFVLCAKAQSMTQSTRLIRIASESTLQVYRARAARVLAALKEHYWVGDHFSTNYPGLFKDELWYDDQVWANYFGLSSASQSSSIYTMLSTDPGGTCKGKGE
jgi:hypothetical protein